MIDASDSAICSWQGASTPHYEFRSNLHVFLSLTKSKCLQPWPIAVVNQNLDPRTPDHIVIEVQPNQLGYLQP